jgi:hypothetical protein
MSVHHVSAGSADGASDGIASTWFNPFPPLFAHGSGANIALEGRGGALNSPGIAEHAGRERRERGCDVHTSGVGGQAGRAAARIDRAGDRQPHDARCVARCMIAPRPTRRERRRAWARGVPHSGG